jgi:hypothetical protein
VLAGAAVIASSGALGHAPGLRHLPCRHGPVRRLVYAHRPLQKRRPDDRRRMTDDRKRALVFAGVTRDGVEVAVPFLTDLLEGLSNEPRPGRPGVRTDTLSKQ